MPRTTAAPAALGAVETTRHVRIVGGGTLAPGLTLPRLGGSAGAPLVLTPCERQVRLTGPGLRPVAPSGPKDHLVVLDPGHGGHADGTLAADGTREADLTLPLALEVQKALGVRVGRVVLTRSTDIDTGLGFRVALADTLRADLAVSVHFDANPGTTRSPVPGMQVYGALSDPHGRRAAGVVYQAERRYMDELAPRVNGRWSARRNYGALYRRGSHGDYYYLLRESHVTWVIAESLFLSAPREAALAKDAGVRRGLAGAMATGITDYVNSRDAGSGWRQPRAQPADPIEPGPSFTCRDPA